MKILLAEDSIDMQYLLSMWLNKYGYTVIIAENGQQAWDILQQQPDIQLVLTDWMMPAMDGIELCQTIREDADWKSYIYIILMTAAEDKNAVVQGMEAGADDFLIKPVNPNELRVRLSAGERIIQLEKKLANRNQALINSKHKVQKAYEQISLDLETAATTQKALLPEPGTLGTIQFNWFFYPCSFVAGDMFNYFKLNDEYLGFYHLDVAGHGVSAALLSFTLHHRIINHPAHKGLLVEQTEHGYVPVQPEKVVTALNQEFQSSTEQIQYFTMIYGYIHQPSGEIRLTQAGHPKPVHFSRINHKTSLCGEGGFPVGMLPDMHYDSFSIYLQPGDRFFIYSDGVTECMSSENSSENLQFSESRLLHLLEENHDLPLALLLEKVGTALRTWRNEKSFDDDVTMLAFERL